jgi:hypothetical protein
LPAKPSDDAEREAPFTGRVARQGQILKSWKRNVEPIEAQPFTSVANVASSVPTIQPG